MNAQPARQQALLVPLTQNQRRWAREGEVCEIRTPTGPRPQGPEEGPRAWASVSHGCALSQLHHFPAEETTRELSHLCRSRPSGLKVERWSSHCAVTARLAVIIRACCFLVFSIRKTAENSSPTEESPKGASCIWKAWRWGLGVGYCRL